MKVNKLIILLQKMPQNSEVIIEDIEQTRYSPKKIYTEVCDIWNLEKDIPSGKQYIVTRLD